MVINNDRRATNRDIAQENIINIGSVHTHLRDHLDMRKFHPEQNTVLVETSIIQLNRVQLKGQSRDKISMKLVVCKKLDQCGQRSNDLKLCQSNYLQKEILPNDIYYWFYETTKSEV